MTTASWSTVVDHSSDAGFRTWGSELNTKFASVGMVQTADTGQINWTTVTRAGANSDAGYEIWKTPNGNLYLKILYGTGGTTTTPRISIQVGQGSNGTGTLTGQTSTSTVASNTGNGTISTSTAYQSFLCAKGDYVGLSWKVSSVNGVGDVRTIFVVQPTVDSSGADTSVGYSMLVRGGSPANALLQTVRTTATAQTRNQGSNFCVFVGNPSASTDGTNNQVYIHQMDTPQAQPCLYSGTVISSELSFGTTVSLAIVGVAARTYIAVCGNSALTWDAGKTTSPVMALIMLWE